VGLRLQSPTLSELLPDSPDGGDTEPKEFGDVLRALALVVKLEDALAGR